ncbi:arylsulfatase [Bacillus sp. EB600]|uniref:arylsulfatase n=1 Tax=Bacillus sp. EB600 TaxID=2806345 RepID=UPI00210921D2|nr:arylsulfatase [Bacillus sp. EB600]MCQ6280045.1 arylsulfatase [Bacillus sp. EB600]
MKDQKFLSKQSLTKLTMLGTAVALASAITINGHSAIASVPPKEKEADKKKSKTNAEKKKEDTKTNVVYIVLDDSGFSDLGSYGSEIKTPNIDWLSQNGLRYNNSHVTPLCSPTRASLLTGRNSHEVGIGTVTNFDLGPEFPNKRGELKPGAGTVAQVLGKNGYNTYAAGKWHLAPTEDTTPAGPYNNWPLQKGFDQFYGFLEDSSDQYKPDLTIDNTQIPSPTDPNYHFSEAIVENANRYITNQVSVHPETPYFLYLTFGAQHSPQQVPQKYIDMYKGVYDKGWDQIREQRFEKQKELGIIPKDAKLAPRNPGVKPWDELTDQEKKNDIRLQETYAGFLTHADEQVGKLLDNLREKNQLDKTMIVLLSDNGASGGGKANGSVNHTEDYNGISENIDDIERYYDMFGSPNAGTEYPAGWAQVSNTPFSQYKNSAFAGGTNTPLIVYNPKIIKDPGAIRTQYVNVSDITPTIYDIEGIKPPKQINGVKQMPISGQSFKASLTNPKAAGRSTQYFEVSGNRAIYHDGWKAFTSHKKGEPFEKDQWYLYHVKDDYSESTDLAAKYPDKLKELQKLWFSEAKKYGALPLTDIFLDGFLSIPADTIRAKDHYMYYRGMDRLTDSAAPPIMNRSYEIKIPIERSSNTEDGVLLALGGQDSGYTIFIKNNKLIYEYRYGLNDYKIVSTIDVPLGKSVILYKFDKTGTNKGNGALYINDTKVGESIAENTLPYKISFEGLDIGKDTKYPVSPDYANEGEFAFKGKLTSVEYTLGNDQEFTNPGK